MFFLRPFQIVKQDVYLLLENLVQLSDSNLDFMLIILVFDRYLFQLIVLLKLDFNCGNNFTLSWVYKVTTGTFVSVISEVGLWFAALV